MKKKLILLSMLPVALLTATIVFDSPNPEEGVYESRNSSSMVDANGSAGMLDYYHQLRGNYTEEDHARVQAEVAMMPVDRATVTWNEQGPDNVGGRTRAILIDRNDINHVYAGSVSGGLFESFNRGNYWTPVTTFMDNLAISSMCQTVDGTVYVATGHFAEGSTGSQNAYDSGANGDGIFKMESNGSFTQLAGTSTFTYVNEIVCDDVHNDIWIATSIGVRKYNATDGLTTVAGPTPGSCNAIDISKDGNVIVAGTTGGKTNVSTDGNSAVPTFTDVSGSGPGQINAGASRMEYSISHERGSNGNYYVYAVGGSSFLLGVYMSQDNGLTWTQTAPANNQLPGSFAPFTTGGGGGQANYDMIISAVKGNPEKMLLGGIDTYSWATTGNWTQLSQWFLSPQNDQYVHADNHEMVWDDLGRLYIGNDGGIQISDDGGQTFYPANRGYNVSQFYAIGMSAHGDVIGGLQDNGTFTNYHDNSTWHEFDEVGGGDGFSSEISFINRDVLFSSVYYSAVRRSPDRGGNSTSFVPVEFSNAGLNALNCNAGATDGSGCGQFFTNFRLWENPNDVNSTDSVSFVPQQAYTTNDTIEIPSQTAQTTIYYETPTDVVYDDTVDFNSGLTTEDTVITSIAPSNDYNLTVFEYTITAGAHPLTAGDSIYLVALDTTVEIDSYTTIPHYWGTNILRPGKVVDMNNDPQVYGIAWDTLTVQDKFQSWMVIGLGGGDGIWMTRNALRFSAPSDEWFRVNHSNISQVSSMEFSHDGQHLFIGTWNGALYRLSGFGDVYSPAKNDDLLNGVYADTLIDVNNVAGIDNDSDNDSLKTTWTQIGSFGTPVTGIGIQADPDNVTVSLGSYTAGAKIRETTVATTTTTTTTFSGVAGNLPSGLPCYGIVMVDAMNWVIGTDMGTYSTEDGGTTWANCSGGIGNTPVFDMRINWRSYDDGCLRPNEIYAGTHGRGIWSSEAYLALPGQQDNLDADKFVPNIMIYPNPLVEQGTIAFSLESSSNVTVQIFNLSGQLVKEMNETNASVGVNNFTFGASDLSKGTYIVRLTAGDKVETTKFIKH